MAAQHKEERESSLPCSSPRVADDLWVCEERGMRDGREGVKGSLLWASFIMKKERGRELGLDARHHGLREGEGETNRPWRLHLE